jgi:hypothetical protein
MVLLLLGIDGSWASTAAERFGAGSGRGQPQRQRAHGQQQERRWIGDAAVHAGVHVDDDRTDEEQDQAGCGRDPEERYADAHQQAKGARRLESTQREQPSLGMPSVAMLSMTNSERAKSNAAAAALATAARTVMAT